MGFFSAPGTAALQTALRRHVKLAAQNGLNLMLQTGFMKAHGTVQITVVGKTDDFADKMDQFGTVSFYTVTGDPDDAGPAEQPLPKK